MKNNVTTAKTVVVSAACKTTLVVAYTEQQFKERVSKFQGGYTTVLVPGHDGQLTVSDQNGPMFIEDGPAIPIFTDRFIKGLPNPGDALILEVTNQGGRDKVIRWGYNCFWEASQKRIAARPQFRVTNVESFLGQPVLTKKKFKPTFTGCLQALVVESLRDGLHISRIDRFAPTYVSGPITVTNRFERLEGAVWVPCEDPRPFPEGLRYRLVYNNHGDIGVLADGTALKINWDYPRGLNDKLSKIGSDGSNQFIYWERFDPGSARLGRNESEWTEVADPRPMPAVQIQKKLVAMPKQERKEFTTALKSLNDLDKIVPVLGKSGSNQ